jgi:hypothetical protein
MKAAEITSNKTTNVSSNVSLGASTKAIHNDSNNSSNATALSQKKPIEQVKKVVKVEVPPAEPTMTKVQFNEQLEK